jgi:O-antigen/teichoic acid export membrane protein
MASLRANVVFSLVATVLVGATRPAFNAVINRAFGPEVNGRAASVIALIFLASLPATASVPTVMVRHVSRALGAGARQEAAGHARLGSIATLLLAAVGILVALIHGRLVRGMAARELALVALGVASYSYWRLYRTLLLAAGEIRWSLAADLVSALALALGLGSIVLFDLPGLAVGAFVTVYVAYVVLTAGRAFAFERGGALGAEARASFLRYTALWFVGTAASLAARELTLLLLEARSSESAVGELSVALSLLMLLAFAPRIIEVPLVHELSLLAGQNERARQVELTNRALDWLTVVTFAAGFGAAILAGPILAIVGNVKTPVIVLSFVVITIAFMAEMIVTPAGNLLVTEARPRVQAIIGGGSLLLAFLWWYSPWCEGVLGVVAGLAVSHLSKAVAISWYARSAYGVSILVRPAAKLAALALGGAALYAVLGLGQNPYAAALLFELAMLPLFAPELRAMLAAVRG